MKRLFKRWLAMVLAVLMVMGTLPMTAWAARIEDDVRPATPVVDGNDGVVDTLAKSGKDDDVRPIDPVDPDPEPVDPAWYNWTIEITKLTNDGEFEVTVTGGANANSGNWGFVIAPNVSNSTASLPSMVVAANQSSATSISGAMTADAGLKAGMFYATGNPASNIVLDENGKAVISGNLPAFSALLGQLNGYVDKDGNSDFGEGVEVYAALVTAGGDTQPGTGVHIVAEATKHYGGGIGDSVWLVKPGDYIKKQEGDEWVEVEGTDYAGATNTVSIPLVNTSETPYYIPYGTQTNTGGATEFVSIVAGNAIIPGQSTNPDLSTVKDEPASFSLRLPDKNPQTIILTMPYYAQDEGGNGTKVGTANVTIIVISGEYLAEEIVFNVTADQFGSGNPISYPITIKDFDLDNLFDASADESVTTVGDTELGLSLVPADSFDPTAEDLMEYYESISMIYGTLTETYESEDGEEVTIEHSGTAKVTLTPDDVTKDYDDYKGGNTYRTMIQLTNAYSDDGNYYSVDIPVKIIVEPGDVEQKYDIEWVNPASGAPTSMSPGLPNDSTQYTAGQTTTAWTNPAATGWTFKGWTTKSGTTLGATATTYTVNAADADDSNVITLTAVWEKLKYNITYTKGTGNVPAAATISTPNPVQVAHGDNHTLKGSSDVTGVTTGWVFDGWTEDGADVTGSLTNVTGPHNLTAKWKVTVTYYDNTTKLGDEEVAVATGKATSAPTPTKAGHSFSGWSTTNGGSVDVDLTTRTFTEPTPLYAVWTQNMYLVTYTAGDLNSDTTIATYIPAAASAPEGNYTVKGLTGTLPTPILDDNGKGWTFTGWKVGETGYAAGATYSLKAPVTFVAQWSPVNRKVTFNKGNGPADTTITVPASSTTVQHGTTNYGAADATTSASDWNFTGWSITPNTYTVAGGKIEQSITSDVTLTAQWAAKVDFVDNGATSGTFTDQWVAYGGKVTDPGADRTGYTLDGWYTETAFTNKWDFSSNTVTKPTTLYAKWTEKGAPGVVKVKLDSGAYPGLASSITLKKDGSSQSATFTESPSGTYTTTSSLGVGTYNVYINNVDTKKTFSVSAGSCTPAEVQYWTVTVVTNGNGDASLSSTDGASAATDYQNNKKSADAYVLDESEVTWAFGTPQTYYTPHNWDGDTTSSNPTGNLVRPIDKDATKSHTAYFQQLNCEVTVNIKNKPVTGSDTDHNFTGDVKLGSTYTSSITNAATATFTVPQSDTSYDIYLGNDNTSVSVIPNAGTKAATVYFYELKVTAGANGSASLAGTTIATGTSASEYYLPGTTGIAIGATGNTDWGFLNWTGDTGNVTGLTVGTASNTITTDGKTASLTANFQKEAFTIKLTLNLNDQARPALDSAGGDITAMTVVRTDGKADTATHTLSYNGSKWTVSGLQTGTTYKVTVTTRTGTYDAHTDITTDKDDYVIDLYSLDVAAGTYGNATNKPYVGTTSTVKRAVVPKGIDVTLAANPDNTAWSQTGSGWVEQGKTTVPSGMTVSANSATFKTDYNAATAGTGVTLTPVYTFSVKVQVQDSANKPMDANANTLGVGSGTVTGPTSTGSGLYTISGLDPATATFTLSANGYTSNKTFTRTDANTTVDLILYKISVLAYDDSNSGAAQGGTPKISSANAVYIPQGNTTAADLTLTATADTTYRLANSANTGDSDLWTIKTADSGATLSAVNSATAGKVSITSIGKDIEIYAHFVKQFDATVSVTGNNNSGTKAEFTGKESDGTNIKTTTTADVDKGTYVMAVFTPGVGDTLENWEFSDGDLYYDLKDGKVDPAKQLTNKGPTTANYTTVYFVPTKAGAKLIANVTTKAYRVKVTVNQNNTELPSGIAVQLKKDNTGTPIDLTYSSTDKWYADVIPGSYTIYTNVANGKGSKTDNAPQTAIKTINFDADDGEKSINPAHTKGDAGDLTKEVNYYTIKVERSFSDNPADANKPDSIKANFGNSGSKTSDSKIMLATTAEQENQAIFATSDNHGVGTPYYRFNGWTVSQNTAATPADAMTIKSKTANSTTFTLPKESELVGNENIATDGGITLTANFQREYKVTVKRGSSSLTTSNSLVKVKKASDSTAWGTLSDSVFVDAGTAAKLYATSTNTNYVLKDWSIAKKAAPNETQDDGAGTFKNAGHTITAANSATNLGYLFEGKDDEYTNFTPAKDTVLQVNIWTRPSLAGNWTYDISRPEKSSPVPPDDRTSTWTENNASEVTAVEVVKISDRSPVQDLDGHYTAVETATGSGEYKYTVDGTFLADTANHNIALDTNYYLQLTYKLGEDGHPNRLTGQTAGATATVRLTSTQRELKKVTIEEATTSDKNLNENDSARDQAVYVSHQEKAEDSNTLVGSAIPAKDLEFTWYYTTNPPTQSDLTTTYTAAQISTLITTGKNNGTIWEFDAALAGEFTTASSGKIKKGTLNVDATSLGTTVAEALKGKYVFAVVKVADSSTIGKGAVITNPLSVDYDAKITLKKDADAVTAYDNYKVYLVPTGEDGTLNPATDFATDAARDAKGIKVATRVATDADGVYSTTGSALDVTKNYYVYVNDVEDATTTHHNYVKADTTAISRATQTKTVQYYSVTLETVQSEYIDHKKDSTNKNVGETFNDDHPYPSFNAATGNNTNIPSGNGVLKGSTVSAKAKDLGGDNAGKGWTQDYTMTWKYKSGAATNFTPVTTQKRTNETAVTSAYAYATTASPLNAKVTLSGDLEQNLYTITGDIKRVGTGSPQIVYGNTDADRPKLTVGEYTFYPSKAITNGGDGGTVEFTVPRSSLSADEGKITGEYTLTATAAKSPATTLKGYRVPAGDWTATSPAPTTGATATLEELSAKTSGADLNNRFTIFIEASNAAITVKDDTDPVNSGSASGKGTAAAANFTDTTAQWKKVFANYSKAGGDKMTYDVTITNDGNVDLKVTLTSITKDTPATTPAVTGAEVFDGTQTLDAANGGTLTDPDNGVTIDHLKDQTFDLEAKTGSQTFRVTIPVNLDNDDDVTYHFNFTTADARTGYTSTDCPKGQYDLKLLIDPVTVSSVSTDHPMKNGEPDPMTFEVVTTRIQEDDDVSSTYTHSYGELKKPTKGGGAPNTTTDDLVYEWYYANWDTEVEFKDGTLKNKATGNGLTQLTTADGVSTDTLSYTMNDTTMGKTLYLLVKGQNNAKGAATTPDVIGEPEPPMFLPYTAKIKVREDGTPITAKTGHAVYLWDTANGDFDPTSSADIAKLIDTEWVDPAGGKDGYFKADNLPSASYDATTKTKKVYTYQVWAKQVKGKDLLQSANLTITVDDTANKVVDYYQVLIADTAYNQGVYAGNANFTPDTNSTIFLTGTLTQTKPEANIKGDATNTITTGTFVQSGNTVTFGYDDWVKDYTLTWGGPASGTATPGAKAEKDVTYNGVKTAVTTTLSLNTYEVEASVVGSSGSVKYIYMSLVDGDTTHVFTSETDEPAAGSIVGIVGGSKDDRISAGSSVKFQLPKAAYEAKGNNNVDSAAKFVGYTDQTGTNQPYNGDVTPPTGSETLDVNVTGAGVKYSVNLQGEGLSLQYTDNVPDGLNSRYVGTHSTVTGQTTIVNHAESNPVHGTQTVYLNYNYNERLTVTLNAVNFSRQGNDAPSVLKNVTYTTTSSTDATRLKLSGNNDFATGKDLSRTGTTDNWVGEKGTVEIIIEAGLPVGQHTYKGKFTFEDEDGHSASTNYTLNVIVEPLTFTAVKIKPETEADGTTKTGNMTIVTYDAESKAEGTSSTPNPFPGIVPATAATDPDPDTALKQNPDYAYQWISAPASMSESDVKAAVSWSNGVLSVDETGGVLKCTGTSTGKTNTDRTYTPNDADAGRNIFLVIYGKDNATATDNADRRNATGFVVSNTEKNTYKGIVTLKVDGDPKKGKDDADSAIATKTNDGDGYEVVFVNEDNTSKTVPAKWTTVGTEYAYVADLEPNTKGYSVKISRARDNATQVPLTGALITGAALAPANTINTTYSNVVEAEFYTVTALKFYAKEFKKGTGEPFDYNGGKHTENTDIIPNILITTGGPEAALTSGTPVLKDQEIAAKVEDLGEDNAGKGWTQDYNLTWREKADNGVTITTDDKTVLIDTTKNAGKNQSNTDAVTTGYDYGKVSKKTYIGGRLDQNTYTVVGTVRNPTGGPTGGNVDRVDLAFAPETGDTRTFTFKTYTSGTPGDNTTSKVYETGKLTDTAPMANNGTYGEPGDTATFTVVRGAYNITAYEGTNSSIQYVTIGGYGDPKVTTESTPDLTHRNTEKLTPKVDGANRTFSVYVAQRKLNLGVQGKLNTDTPNTALTKLNESLALVGSIGVAEKAHVIYYNGTATGTDTLPLTLTNPAANPTANPVTVGTGDLNVVAEVYRLDAVPTDYSDTAVASWASKKGTVTAEGTYTDTQDSVKVMEINGLPTSTKMAFVPVGAGDTGAGSSAAVAGGTMTINQTSTTLANAVYVIRYTSTREKMTFNGGTETGPTVFYVLDFTVEPLPIEKVAKPVLNNASTGELKVSADDFSDVTVSYKDTAGANQTATADGRGLDGTDVIYVWAKAPKDVTVTKNSFTLADNASIAVSAAVAGDGVELVNTDAATTQTTYTPEDAEQGMNFYLLAVRSTADGANATDFAVSEPMYAQVTVALEARRSKDVEGPGTGGDLLTVVELTGVLGEGDDAVTKKSNTGTGNPGFTVTEAGTITITADETADKTDPINEPANAEYYFVGWGVDPADAATVPSERSLTWAYPVTKKSTVIGYYDWLPTLEGSSPGYNTSSGADGYGTDTAAELAARTLKYEHRDGSGKVEIYLEWEEENETTGETEFKSLPLTVLEFASTPSSTMGDSGEYILDAEFVRSLEARNYQITFYDMDKGVNGGVYEGYDRSTPYAIIAGEKTVIAEVKDISAEGAAPEYGGKVRITNGANPPGENPPGENNYALKAELATYNAAVTLYAKPDDGYVFVEWTKEKDPDNPDKDKGKGKLTNAKNATTAYTGVVNLEEKVFATFAKAKPTMDEVKAKILYGGKDFEGDDPVVITATSAASGTAGNTGFTEDFKYTIATDAELTAEGIDPDLFKKPEWLALDEDTGEFSVATGKTVDTNVVSTSPTTYTAVDNEVVVYVIATAQSTKETVFAKVTIDVEPGQLTVVTAQDGEADPEVARGEAYKNKNLADPDNPVIPVDENGIPMYNQTVLKQLFEYTLVKDQEGTTIDSTGVAGNKEDTDSGKYKNGTWTVSPGQFKGTGEVTDYTFTFTYKPDTPEEKSKEKWNYKAGTSAMTLIIAKPPVGATFADTILNFEDVESVLKPAPWDRDHYTNVETPADYDGTSGKAPEALAHIDHALRKGETITYLDTEPQYQVRLESLDAAIHGVRFNIEELDGFELDPDVKDNAYPDFTTTNDQFAHADGEKTFVLRLTTRNEDGLWKGTHTATFTLTGYASQAEKDADPDGENPTVTASYTLVIEVLPKPITSLNIEIENPEDETPKTVKGTLEGSDTPTDLTKPDDEKHHVTPLKNIEIVPEIGPDNETVIKRTVEVEIDPNYIYVKDDDTTPDDNEDITENTKLNGKGKTDGNIDVERKPLPADPEKPDDPEDTDHIVFITQRIPTLMFDDVKTDDGPTTPYDPEFTGPSKDNTRGKITITKGSTPTNQYEIHLGAYGSSVYAIDVEMLANGLEGATLTPEHTDNHWNVGTLDDVKAEPAGDKYTWTLDLSGLKTEAPGTYNIKLHAKGYPYEDPLSDAIEADYTITIVIPNPPSPSIPADPSCPCKVFYHIGIHGTTTDPTVEDVAEKLRPTKVPSVTPVDGYTFRGWSLTNPATLKDGEKITLVDPKTVEPKGEAMTFYAVIQQRPFHEHYVIGYPNGNFGPADDITRASVATIIARAILPDFVEGANYGNPGGYSDVSGHWAESAIAYCSKFGVFNGMPDGTFQPDRPISRQEFALVIARLDGVMEVGEMDFTDTYEAGEWALGGIYTAYARGWVNGYPDGSFKPKNNIRRDEAVKVFNAYLHRGVDADGLRDLYEYVHTGSASNNTGNGIDEYKTWADVPREHWAYYEIIEAANDHEYEAEMDGTYTVPETWNKCWIDERWRYIDSASNGGIDTALVSAGFQVWLH